MNNPKLSVVLVPHFTPAVVSATTFVHLYRKVTVEVLNKNVDFILDVLTKVRSEISRFARFWIL